jgi:hypothetical protein
LAIALSTLPPTDYAILLVPNLTPSVLSTRKPSFFVLFLNLLNHSLSRPLYLLGYIPSHNRVYLTDKDHRIFGYALSLSVVEYQTAILRGDTAEAAEIAMGDRDGLKLLAGKAASASGVSPFFFPFSLSYFTFFQ